VHVDAPQALQADDLDALGEVGRSLIAKMPRVCAGTQPVVNGELVGEYGPSATLVGVDFPTIRSAIRCRARRSSAEATVAVHPVVGVLLLSSPRS